MRRKKCAGFQAGLETPSVVPSWFGMTETPSSPRLSEVLEELIALRRAEREAQQPKSQPR